MTLHAGRRRFAIALAVLVCARGVAQETPAHAVGRDDPGLQRLEAALERQLALGKSALPLPWRETILEPDKARLVWRAHSLSAPNGADSFRVAIDPPTRWYYIGQAGHAGAPLTLYGPLEESATGGFVDALAAAGAQTPTAPQAKPASKPRPKPTPKSKSKPKSSTKVKN